MINNIRIILIILYYCYGYNDEKLIEIESFNGQLYDLDIEQSSSLFSSLQCTGGVQDIHCSHFDKPFALFPHAHKNTVRICKFRNVCYINGEIIFYADNESARNLYNPSTFENDDLLFQRKIKVVNESLPQEIPFSEHTYAVLHKGAIGFNMGHFLIDEMMSVFFAIDLWDIPEDDMRLYTDGFCTSERALRYNKVETCHSMFNNMFGLIFDKDKQILKENDTLCFKNLIMGYEYVFSLTSLELARAGFARRFRDRIVARAGYLLQSKSTNHRIIVLTKSSDSITFKSNYLKNNLCSLVKRYSEEVLPSPEVICTSDISTLSFREQLELSMSATIVITEHGATAYFILFVRTGTVAIILSPMEDEIGIKDAQIFLHLTHVQAFYLRPRMNMEMVFENDLYATLQHALYVASDNFGIRINTKLLKDSQPVMSKHLRSIVDSITSFSVTTPNNTKVFEFFWSQDRCTSSYRWCMHEFHNISMCEDVYKRVKESLKFEDSKLLYDCN